MILKYFSFINENLQLADKYFFDKNILSQDDKDLLLSVCKEKKFFFLLSQIHIYYNDKDFLKKESDKNNLQIRYEELVTYDKKFININLDLYKFYSTREIGNIIENLKYIKKIKDIFNDLPSIALRNLKHELRNLQDYEIKSYSKDLSYFYSNYLLLSNKPDLYKKKINQKIFKKGVTLSDLIKFSDDKYELFLDDKVSKKEIIDIIEESHITDDRLNIVYEKNDILVVEVSDPSGIKDIGLYSLWCFTYGDSINYYQWKEYSYNDIVYVIFDFSCKLTDPYFSFVLIRPFKLNNPDNGDFSLYNNYNEPIEENPRTFLKNIMGCSFKEINKIFTFKSIMDDFY